MANLISQLRNETQPQTQLNNSIEQTKQLMQQLMNMPNRQEVINNIIKSNPQLASLMQSKNGLEAFARSYAQMHGIDINTILNQLNT